MRYNLRNMCPIIAALLALATVGASDQISPSKFSRRHGRSIPRHPPDISGTIVAMNERFVLKDDTKDALYGLDNQALARMFVGQKVSVTGTLDKTGMLHIRTIEQLKAERRKVL